MLVQGIEIDLSARTIPVLASVQLETADQRDTAVQGREQLIDGAGHMTGKWVGGSDHGPQSLIDLGVAHAGRYRDLVVQLVPAEVGKV